MRISKDMMLFNVRFLLCSFLGSILNPILNPIICSIFVIFGIIFGFLFYFVFDIFWVLLGSCLWFLEGVLGGSWAQNLNKTYGFSRFLKMVFFGIFKYLIVLFGSSWISLG